MKLQKERDEAIERANESESKVKELKSEIELLLKRKNHSDEKHDDDFVEIIKEVKILKKGRMM